MHALIIDDAMVVRTIVGHFLRDLGYTVTEAPNGREGLARLREHGQIQLVLVDWNMPEMTGIEFVRAVRADSRFDLLPLVMVTAETEREHVHEALSAGASEYVMKPFTKDMIAEKIQLLAASAALRT